MNVHDTTTTDRTEYEQTTLNEPGGYSVEPVEAAGCGALGCHNGESLLEVTDHDGRRRVLCPDHAADFLRTEVIA